MGSGTWVAVLGVTLSAVLTVGGWVVSHLLTRIRTMEALVETKNGVIETKNETIADLKEQRNDLKVSAEIQDRVFKVLAQLPPGKEQ